MLQNSGRVIALLLAVATLFALPTLAAPPAAPAGASVDVVVQVPDSLRQSPFDQQRTLKVPPGFTIGVVARVGQARFMAVAPNGDLLVSQPGDFNTSGASTGVVKIIRFNPTGDPAISDFATNVNKPHDIVFHAYAGKMYVFIAATDAIYRYEYTTGDLIGRNRQTVVKNLPSASLPELKGSYGHQLKNIAIDSKNMLYISIASATNADPNDLAATPKRGAIYTYDATASDQDAVSGTLFAQGIRNAEGLAFVPGSDDLWVVVNNRDNIACPTDLNPIPGTSENCTAGQVSTTYVDNHPPEEFTRVVQGGNYGWPFCNPNPDTGVGMDTMPFDRDYQNNKDGSRLDCGSANRISKGIQAHSAPLGLTFLAGTNAPLAYRNGVIVGLHGSWNRTVPTGYKFAYFPWDSAKNMPGAQIDLVTGFKEGGWGGRPVDAAVAPDGSIYLSDDGTGTIYRLASTTVDPTSTPTSAPTAVGTATPQPTPDPRLNKKVMLPMIRR